MLICHWKKWTIQLINVVCSASNVLSLEQCLFSSARPKHAAQITNSTNCVQLKTHQLEKIMLQSNWVTFQLRVLIQIIDNRQNFRETLVCLNFVVSIISCLLDQKVDILLYRLSTYICLLQFAWWLHSCPTWSIVVSRRSTFVWVVLVQVCRRIFQYL